MPAEPRASLARFLCFTASVAAALMAGGCSMEARMPAPMYSVQHPPSPNTAMTPRVVPPGAAPFDDAVDLASKLKYPQAEIEFRQSLVWFQAAGDKDRSAECLFWIAFCQEKLGRTAEARAQYDKVIRDCPGTPAARMAAERMARLPAKEG